MLDQKTIDNPKAVEELFCIPFGKLPQHPMDEEMTGFMAEMNMASLMNGGKAHNIPKKDTPPILLMFEDSLATRFSFEIPDQTLRFFISVQAGTVGIIIMYLTYLQYECKKRGIKELDWMQFTGLFARGFPVEPDLQTLWEMQKIKRRKMGEGSDNLLDYQSAMVSIQYLEDAKTK
jgi:hypothetical protein